MLFSEIDSGWEEIQKQFQNICILRREGRNDEAVKLMEKKLSPLLATWTSDNPENGLQKKQRLENLFEEEIKRVDDAWVTKNLLDDRLLQPFLKELTETLRPLVDRIERLEKRSTNDLKGGFDDIPITTDFEAALEPIRMELDSLKKTIALAQLDTPSEGLNETAAKKLTEQFEAQHQSREEMFIETCSSMRDEIAGIRKSLENERPQESGNKNTQQLAALSAQIKDLAAQIEKSQTSDAPQSKTISPPSDFQEQIAEMLAQFQAECIQPLADTMETYRDKHETAAKRLEIITEQDLKSIQINLTDLILDSMQPLKEDIADIKAETEQWKAISQQPTKIKKTLETWKSSIQKHIEATVESQLQNTFQSMREQLEAVASTLQKESEIVHHLPAEQREAFLKITKSSSDAIEKNNHQLQDNLAKQLNKLEEEMSFKQEKMAEAMTSHLDALKSKIQRDSEEQVIKRVGKSLRMEIKELRKQIAELKTVPSENQSTSKAAPEKKPRPSRLSRPIAQLVPLKTPIEQDEDYFELPSLKA